MSDITQSLIRELKHTKLFQNVTDQLIKQTRNTAEPISLYPGEILLSPEQENKYLYLVLSGKLGLHFGSPNSPEVHELSAGGSVGEMSLIDYTTPSAYVIAKQPSRVFPIHKDIFNDLLQNNSPLARNMLQILSHRLKTSSQKIAQSHEYIKALTNDINIDSLTGIYNRRWLDRTLSRLLTSGNKRWIPLTLLFIDVDHFKSYNDSYGHPGGDQALITLASVLKKSARPYDFFCRYGGEEFVVLLQNTSHDVGLSVAERIRSNIEAEIILDTNNVPLPSITVSIGVTTSTPKSTPSTLIRVADNMLYQAKKSGRNCICVNNKLNEAI